MDKKTINLWNRKQWLDEFKKNGARVIVLSLSTKVIGISVFQIVIDEAQIHYFSIHPEFRRNGYGTYLMKEIINRCKDLNLTKILLEVSERNLIAGSFYINLDFFTVGVRKKYYKDGSNAVLKEKKLIK